MDYRVDLDPAHGVIRLTVTAEIVTLELAEDIYICLTRIASSGGPYAAIYDLSEAKSTTLTTDAVRGFAPLSVRTNGKNARGCWKRAMHIWIGSCIPDVSGVPGLRI